MKKALVYHLLITLVWMFLSDHASMGGLVVGVATGFLLIMLFRKALDCQDYIRRVLAGLKFICIYIILAIESNFRIASMVLRKNAKKIPGEFIYYDVTGLTFFEKLLICQAIGMTPGTIVAEADLNGDTIVVHIFASGTAEEVNEALDKNLKENILAFTR